MIQDKNGTRITFSDYVMHNNVGVCQIFTIRSETNIFVYTIPDRKFYSVRAQDIIRIKPGHDLTIALLKQKTYEQSN